MMESVNIPDHRSRAGDEQVTTFFVYFVAAKDNPLFMTEKGNLFS